MLGLRLLLAILQTSLKSAAENNLLTLTIHIIDAFTARSHADSCLASLEKMAASFGSIANMRVKLAATKIILQIITLC